MPWEQRVGDISVILKERKSWSVHVKLQRGIEFKMAIFDPHSQSRFHYPLHFMNILSSYSINPPLLSKICFISPHLVCYSACWMNRVFLCHLVCTSSFVTGYNSNLLYIVSLIPPLASFSCIYSKSLPLKTRGKHAQKNILGLKN